VLILVQMVVIVPPLPLVPTEHAHLTHVELVNALVPILNTGVLVLEMQLVPNVELLSMDVPVVHV